MHKKSTCTTLSHTQFLVYISSLDHHECIKEWLLHHSECPFCRNIFLNVDKAEHEQCAKSPQQLSKRAQLSYCCRDHGLVEISPQVCRQAQLVDDIEGKIRGEMAFIQKGDLIMKRGARTAMHEEKELTVDEASMMCLGSRSEDKDDATAAADDDLEANGQQHASIKGGSVIVKEHQYLI
jgi:hypothetical protein